MTNQATRHPDHQQATCLASRLQAILPDHHHASATDDGRVVITECDEPTFHVTLAGVVTEAADLADIAADSVMWPTLEGAEWLARCRVLQTRLVASFGHPLRSPLDRLTSMATDLRSMADADLDADEPYATLSRIWVDLATEALGAEWVEASEPYELKATQIEIWTHALARLDSLTTDERSPEERWLADHADAEMTDVAETLAECVTDGDTTLDDDCWLTETLGDSSPIYVAHFWALVNSDDDTSNALNDAALAEIRVRATRILASA